MESFEDSYEVFNIFTKNVLSSNSAKEFLASDKGEKEYLNFIKYRLERDKAIWVPKRKQPTKNSACYNQQEACKHTRG